MDELLYWEKGKVIDALPAIRRLKGVEEAFIRDDHLHVVTAKGLKHKEARLGLEQISMMLPIKPYSGSWYKYITPDKWFFRKHPTLGKIGKKGHREVCIGAGNLRDYQIARTQGPLMTVIQHLAMFQTIQKDPLRRETERSDDAFLSFFILSILSAWALAMLCIIIHSA